MKFDSRGHGLRILFLVLTSDAIFLEDRLPFPGQAGGLAGSWVDADMRQVNGIVRDADLRTLGGKARY